MKKKKFSDEEIKFRKRLRDRNYRFNKLTKNQQRVRIAKDVIQQLDSKKLIATQGTYFETKIDQSQINQQLNRLIENKTCKVCAIGSVFAATVKRANDCAANEMESMFRLYDKYEADNRKIRKYLKKWFNADQLALMETAFEGQCITANSMLLKADIRYKAYKLFNDLKGNADSILRTIMQNIIDNNGKFIL